MSDFIGKTIGGYRIIAQIGLGGMATVYKAYQPSMDRYVAFKVISTHLAQNPTFAQRFRQEAKVIARLEHVHILPVHDHGEEDGYLYLVMRFVEGGTLKDRLESGPLSLEETRRIVAQIGSALEYAHRRGVVHRDLKPSNILIDRQGDCYLTDFGIAKMVEGTLGLTGSGVIGTPHYMAPEQGQSLKVDQRADIYAMGVVIYEMVTGQVPFDAETPFAVVMKHLTEPLPLPRRIKPDLPEAVERIILKALAKAPADRYQSMRDLVAAFDQAVQAIPASLPAADEEVKAPLPAAVTSEVAALPQLVPPGRRRETSKRRWLLAAVGLALLVPVVVILALAGVMLGRAKPDSGLVQVDLGGTATPALVPTPTQTVSQIVHETPTSEPTPSPSPIPVVLQEPSALPTQSLPTPAFTQPVPAPTATIAAAVNAPVAPPSPAGSWQRIADLPRQINALVADPTHPQVLYAGTGSFDAGSGVYKSEDAGLTWRLMVNGLPQEMVNALAFSGDVPPILYAQVGHGEVYASVDGAQSWSQVGVDPQFSCSGCARRMVVSPSDRNQLFIVEAGMAASYSRDGGQNWQAVQDERGVISALSLAMDPADTQVIYLGTEGNGVYKSTDGGETWVAANRGMLDYAINALAVDPVRPQTVYAGGDRGELFKSSDGGGSWSDITGKLSLPEHSYVGKVGGIVIDPAAPDTVYLLADGVGLLASYDGGERWQVLGKPGELNNPWFTAMLIHSDSQLLLVLGVQREGGWRYASD
jgi:serine/threonine protein kinase/photosystem II stability/assembly factor-like uncharacterized protein